MLMKALKHLLLLLLSLVLVIIVLELGLRVFVPGMGDLIAPREKEAPPVSFQPDAGRPGQSEKYDPYLGWVNKPGVSGINYGPDDRQYRARINSRGLRDREIDYEKPTGVKRIEVLGDSFAWGYGLKADERFSDILGKEFPGTQIINMGVVGYSTDQECTFFEQEGIRYSPDGVILLVHDTDIFHNGLRANYGKAKPYFTLQGDRLERQGIPVPRDAPPLEREEKEEILSTRQSGGTGPARFIKKRILAHSRLYQLLSGRLKMIGPLNRLLVKLGLVEPGRSVAEDVRLTGAIIGRLREKMEDSGAGDLLVLLVPSKEVINYHLPGGSGKKLLIRLKDTEILRREEAVRTLAALLKPMGIPAIDLTSEFIETSARGTNLYFIHDNHWNAEANRIAARRVSAYLREKGYN